MIGTELDNKLPQRTVERLSGYRRMLLREMASGRVHIFSHQMAQMHSITAVQVRRDLMLIGFSGDARRGYDVAELVEFIGRILDSEAVRDVAIIGMGNLGQALTHYLNNRQGKLRVTQAYDVDPKKVGASIAGVECFDVDSFVSRASQVELVILTCPTNAVAKSMEMIEASKVKGVLNFTSTSLTFSRDVFVADYDIVSLLEKVAYFTK